MDVQKVKSFEWIDSNNKNKKTLLVHNLRLIFLSFSRSLSLSLFTLARSSFLLYPPVVPETAVQQHRSRAALVSDTTTTHTGLVARSPHRRDLSSKFQKRPHVQHHLDFDIWKEGLLYHMPVQWPLVYLWCDLKQVCWCASSQAVDAGSLARMKALPQSPRKQPLSLSLSLTHSLTHTLSLILSLYPLSLKKNLKSFGSTPALFPWTQL